MFQALKIPMDFEMDFLQIFVAIYSLWQHMVIEI